MARGPIELPRLGAPIADTHAHLVMLDDPAGALERAARAGVEYIVTVADLTESPRDTFDALQSWIDAAKDRLNATSDADGTPRIAPPEVGIIVGAHPHNAKNFTAGHEALLLELLADSRVRGVGEIGLDFHYDYSPRDVQRATFRTQLLLAERCPSSLPVAIHLRDAHEEGLQTLTEVGLPAGGCVIHCFTGDAALAERFVDLGCHISFAGPVTFKRAEEIRAAAAAVPLDRLLLETDCPFLAPEPYRGRTNEPAWTVFTAAVVATAKGIDTAELASATFANSRRVFGRRCLPGPARNPV